MKLFQNQSTATYGWPAKCKGPPTRPCKAQTIDVVMTTNTLASLASLIRSVAIFLFRNKQVTTGWCGKKLNAWTVLSHATHWFVTNRLMHRPSKICLAWSWPFIKFALLVLTVLNVKGLFKLCYSSLNNFVEVFFYFVR